ncbi:peptide/nickel transport system ATP-binding protein [Tamaricihabitans halophyticus]|uniref:Peptide/nickel transport system ATP-binding protein n=1 Tax=Tamaricihabitans halophyticus TaxID=1262583 RepID=A0A4R2R3X3_9PSEU|nr:ABC transporter ATP-binding protein [Tamaricihabitans halophyticus]TCP56429.1 peptide/nickel transport system ATP-binding protein [Tamaricihabitans halophyticus]
MRTGQPNQPTGGTASELLRISELRVDFATEHGWANVLGGVSLDIHDGEIVGLVGESGSGKTVTGLSILGLVPSPPGRTSGGHIWLHDEDLTEVAEPRLRQIRGNEISMIFQEPMTSLNPAFTVGDQISETFRRHRRASRKQGTQRAVEVLDLVGIPNAATRVHAYPHEFSGGMRQRAMIAMALCCDPRLIIADEPTTALDVTVQSQILDLLRSMRAEIGTGILFITHDLGVVAELCDRVVVMYGGEVVETAPVHDLFQLPRHPYTEGLLSAMPQLGSRTAKLASIPGHTPEPWAMPNGCRFGPRCTYHQESCSESPVALESAGTERQARCARLAELNLRGAS